MNSKKILQRFVCLLLAMLLLSPAAALKAENNYYTYIYDVFSDERESPDAYIPQLRVLGVDFGIGDFAQPQGMYAKGDKIYIADTGNNRIVELLAESESLSLVRVIDKFKNNGEDDTFNAPNDIFVTDSGDIYVCDTENKRVVHMDNNLNMIKALIQPTDETYDASHDFLPTKVVVDASGRILVLGRNVNKGVMQYSPEGVFTGYIGASKVTFSMIDYIWKKLATKAQRDQMEQFVPTEYNNIALDKDGFVYVTTSVFSEWDLKDDKAKPIRKLNSMGSDILIKNGDTPPIGDLQWGDGGGVKGPSKLIDVTPLENDIYYAIDRTRCRIFGYDSQGQLLYAFGGSGNMLGYFSNPVALDHIGDDLYVLDSRMNSMTKLVLTNYGRQINNAILAYQKGDYDLSADYWREVLRMNSNYDLAYLGIGRALLRQNRYKEAMKYFELKYYGKAYSKAFKLYRKEWIEDHIGYFVVGLLILIIVPKTIKTIKKVKREVSEE
ncbi:MAG: tetratricopeptide repeat protein [Lachnospiraceae bacterium]|nr:tetratricopeptide repeat protein [Lachnospiraceae bacterium]